MTLTFAHDHHVPTVSTDSDGLMTTGIAFRAPSDLSSIRSTRIHARMRLPYRRDLGRSASVTVAEGEARLVRQPRPEARSARELRRLAPEVIPSGPEPARSIDQNHRM